MDIVTNLDQWETDFKAGWLAHMQKTDTYDWSIYPKLKNKTAPAGPGVDLSQSRLGLISTAGGYLKASQEPFDAPNKLGDYSIRLFSSDTSFDELAYAHEHYDHAAIDEDPQVLLPLHHLKNMVEEGIIGEVAPTVISYSGYQPDVRQLINQTIPAILNSAKAEAWSAALLIPA